MRIWIMGLVAVGFIAACSSESAAELTTATTVTTTATVVSSSGSGGAASGSGGAASGSGGAASGSGGAASGSGGAPSPGPFTLTSSVIVDMGTIPVEHSCKGANVSPPLAWTGAPDNTKSFAIVFRDLSNNLLHSSVWDIPASVTALPKAVEEVAMPKEPAGSKQSKGYNGEYGYQGPCPPNEHSYVFTLYALDVATLPNVTTSSKLADIVKELEVHAILTATLQATFKP